MSDQHEISRGLIWSFSYSGIYAGFIGLRKFGDMLVYDVSKLRLVTS